MTITLSPELEAQVREDAAVNGYEDVENYIQAVLRSPPDSMDWIPDDPEVFHAAIEEGWQQAERGELVPSEEVWKSLEATKAAWHSAKDRNAA